MPADRRNHRDPAVIAQNVEDSWLSGFVAQFPKQICAVHGVLIKTLTFEVGDDSGAIGGSDRRYRDCNAADFGVAKSPDTSDPAGLLLRSGVGEVVVAIPTIWAAEEYELVC